MSESFWIAIIVGFGAPLMLALLTNWNKRREREEDREERRAIAAELKAVGTKIDGMLVTRDASNFSAGQVVGRQAGDDASAQRAEGRRQEREIHRENAALSPHPNGAPVPVADDRTAVAAERGASANERIADAAEKKD